MAGRVAYTQQDPWIRNATLRDNITLGDEPIDRHRYEQVREFRGWVCMGGGLCVYRHVLVWACACAAVYAAAHS